jgi:signal transduction histidine kinase
LKPCLTLRPQVCEDRFQLLAGGPASGRWSPEHVRRAIENLAINAAKYGSGDTPIRIRIEQDSGEARLSIHNLGNPIPREQNSLPESHPAPFPAAKSG